jgi:predicted ATP-binding protein involved in virulence
MMSSPSSPSGPESSTTGSPSLQNRILIRVLMPYLRFLLPKLRYVDEEVLRQPRYKRPLQIAGTALFIAFLGSYGIVVRLLVKDSVLPFFNYWWIISVALLVGGVVAVFFALTFLSGALRAENDLIEGEVSGAELGKEEYRQLENLRKQREREEEVLFRRNLQASFVLQSLELRTVKFFEDCKYRFRPRMNVLLGKNGYGKTLLLRALAALIQSDLYHSEQLLPSFAETDFEKLTGSSFLKLEITQDGTLKWTVRDRLYFSEAVGKVPLLAIPDSRFVDRAQLTVGASATGHEPLSHSGARNFLTQETYEDVIQELLAQLGIEYLERGKKRGFSQPIFRLIESVVRELTGDDEFAFHQITRSGRTGFEILVRTTGSQGSALPIQQASQGTLSVVAIFGLIFTFLQSLGSFGKPEEVLARTAIVIIDELDAHLHPAWQQRIVGMLVERFPNVQFVVSAHSPLIVAGCEWGEVSVLRRNHRSGRFFIETLERDFVGATSRELYEIIFEIDDVDPKYLRYATMASMGAGVENEKEILKLEQKDVLSPDDERRRAQLERETRLMQRVAEIRQERLKDERSRIEELEAENQRLEAEIRRLKRSATAREGGM